jgi:hypothetical protein
MEHTIYLQFNGFRIYHIKRQMEDRFKRRWVLFEGISLLSCRVTENKHKNAFNETIFRADILTRNLTCPGPLYIYIYILYVQGTFLCLYSKSQHVIPYAESILTFSFVCSLRRHLTKLLA